MNSYEIADADLPALFQSADQTAIDSQSWYVLLVRLDLILMVVGALLSSIPVSEINSKSWMNIVGAVLLTIAFFVSMALRFMRYEKRITTRNWK